MCAWFSGSMTFLSASPRKVRDDCMLIKCMCRLRAGLQRGLPVSAIDHSTVLLPNAPQIRRDSKPPMYELHAEQDIKEPACKMRFGS